MINHIKSFYLRHTKFLSEEEIIDDLISTMSEKQIRKLITNPYDQLDQLQSTFGKFVIDRYRLNHPKNPYTDLSNISLSKYLYYNPNIVSLRIIKTLWVNLLLMIN